MRIPGTEIRFGLDVILGLVPVVGDFAGMLCGLPLLVAGIRKRLRFPVLLMMTANVLLDAVMGSIPLVGDIFDIAWKSHRKNLTLLRQPEFLPDIMREASWKLGALVGIVGLLAIMLGGLLIFAVRIVAIGLDWGWRIPGFAGL